MSDCDRPVALAFTNSNYSPFKKLLDGILTVVAPETCYSITNRIGTVVSLSLANLVHLGLALAFGHLGRLGLGDLASGHFGHLGFGDPVSGHFDYLDYLVLMLVQRC